MMNLESTKYLAEFALRVFSTLANSVSSERAFSIQNWIQDKGRNHLKSEKTNKLTYISMNTHILEALQVTVNPSATSTSVKLPHELSNEEEVAIEEGILQDEEISESDIDIWDEIEEESEEKMKLDNEDYEMK